ncbi:NPCBM/NEW2 domain-containing protein [Streptomyces inhibens]|uniref:NPCBM/NEW2 domain-containing protein n=1 Tax=Streptomyces inhibens TaxID=2293571 RepID=UPI00402AF1C0
MQEQFDTIGGTELSDTELVQRIRAAARTDGRATADPYGAPAPDGVAEAGEEALDAFHRRHYAAVLAFARECCRSSQASADLAAEAIAGVLRSHDPGEDPDATWRGSLLAAVRHTAAAWHQNSRSTELRDNFTSWLAGRHLGDGPDPSDTEQESSTGGEPTAAVRPVGPSPSAEPRKAQVSRRSPARIVVLAVAVTALAGVAISVGPLLGPERHDASAPGPGRSGLSSAPTSDQPPTASPRSSATASSSASGTPSATPTKASTQPSSRPTSAKPSPSARPGSEDTPSTAHPTALGARPWTSSKSGWGPVRLNRSIDGRPLTIQGAGYAEGLGAHADSEITYNLGGTCSALSVDVGIDDEVGANGSVVFQIYRDGTKVADSGLMTVDQSAKHLTADLTGGTELRLVVTDGGNGNNSDHADWAGPRITCH